MVTLSNRSRRELFLQQLDIQGQLEDYKDFANADIDGALIDDSLAHFFNLLMNGGSDEELLNLLAYTRAKYQKMYKKP